MRGRDGEEVQGEGEEVRVQNNGLRILSLSVPTRPHLDSAQHRTPRQSDRYGISFINVWVFFFIITRKIGYFSRVAQPTLCPGELWGRDGACSSVGALGVCLSRSLFTYGGH